MSLLRKPSMRGDGKWEVPLTQGYVAIVDADDIDRVSSFNWFCLANRKTVYAARQGRKGEKSTVYMHRIILEAPPDMQVDHIDGNGLNNTRENLRLCTQAENMLNKSTYRNSPTGYRGVYPQPSGKFIARIYAYGKWATVGTFPTAEEAAIARDRAAMAHYGEFARLNVIERKAS